MFKQIDSRRLGVFLGLLVFVLTLFLPLGNLNSAAKAALAVTLLMAIWWMTEAIPIYFTAFLPVALFPILKVMPASATSKNFGNVYLLMLLCGFFIARAIELQGLHRRIALWVLNKLGTKRSKIVLSFMIVSAFLSMWIANVAVALLMLPIAAAVVHKAEENGKEEYAFNAALLLGIAYACSIGGIATLIGTPVNMVFAGMLENLFPNAPKISFATWFKVGLPLTCIFLPVIWYYLIKLYKLKGHIPINSEFFKKELEDIGKMSPGEWWVLGIFVLTAIGWVFKDEIPLGHLVIPGWSSALGLEDFTHDSTVAVISAALLFLIHVQGKPLLSWSEASKVPWGVVMIVGGGYCIAAGFQETGLAAWLGNELAFIGGFSPLLILLAVNTFIIFLTEINSNTATANIFLPVFAALAVASKINPLFLMIPVTFACSFAFMMPSGTGTNTVIFASEKLEMKEMVRAGLGLNLISILLLTALQYIIVMPVLGLEKSLPLWAQ